MKQHPTGGRSVEPVPRGNTVGALSTQSPNDDDTDLLGIEMTPPPAADADGLARAVGAREDAEHEDEPHDSERAAALRELCATRVIGDVEPVAPQPGAGPVEAKKLNDSKPVIVGSDFQLVKKLGEGAMGAVYLARQLSFDRVVALKVLFPHVARNPKLVERLRREANAMFQLDHPNIVQAYAYGEDQGCPYVAMEYIRGKNLQKILTRFGKFSVADAVHIVLRCCRALTYAHKQGMVHRDIKPENILITRTGAVKIADLGMVKTFDDDMSLTQTGHAVGTPWYMPLEQAKNAKETDGRCDIYALGCTLYCLLTGNPPFAGSTIIDVIRAKEQGTFPPARSVNSEVPERLDLVIAKMTAKQPRYRYQTCDEIIQALEVLDLAGPVLRLNNAPPSAPEPAHSASLSSGEIITNATLAGAVTDAEVWYVRFKGPGGQPALRKYTTAEVQERIENGSLQPSAMASHNPHDGFRALATYKELEGVALSRASKAAADKSSTRYRDLYRKIEERERQREETDTARPSMPGWVGPAFTLGTIALGAVIVGAFVYVLKELFR
jgi:serine/threonine-protein kinase